MAKRGMQITMRGKGRTQRVDNMDSKAKLFDQFDFCQGPSRGKRLLPVQRMRDVTAGWSHQKRGKDNFPESMRSLMKIRAQNKAFGYSSLDREKR